MEKLGRRLLSPPSIANPASLAPYPASISSLKKIRHFRWQTMGLFGDHNVAKHVKLVPCDQAQSRNQLCQSELKIAPECHWGLII